MMPSTGPRLMQVRAMRRAGRCRAPLSRVLLLRARYTADCVQAPIRDLYQSRERCCYPYLATAIS